MGRLNRGQQIVGVIGWGVVLFAVGLYLSTYLGGSSSDVSYGNGGYQAFQSASGPTFTTLDELLLSLGIVVLWVVGSALVLRTPKERSGTASAQRAADELT